MDFQIEFIQKDHDQYMKKINLGITGCLGRMGQQLIKSSKSNKNFKLVSYRK